MITDNNYLVVQGWMINKLHLSGNELLCFALIYGFSQDGNSVFSGTASYIAQWIGIDKRNVYPILTKLVEKGYIDKIDKIVNNVKLCDYKITSKAMKICQGGSDETSGGSDETSHHNIIDNNIDINIQKKTKNISLEQKKESIKQFEKTFGKFVGKNQVLITKDFKLPKNEYFDIYRKEYPQETLAVESWIKTIKMGSVVDFTWLGKQIRAFHKTKTGKNI